MCINRRSLLSGCLMTWICLAGCQAPRPAAPIERAAPTPPPAPPVEEKSEPTKSPTTGMLPVDPTRWVYVERIQEGASDPWVKGTFDRARNKISIETRQVRRFAIDVSRLPINWDRLVVLGINGRNSELRKRDFVIYHFEHDEYGRWAVQEP